MRIDQANARCAATTNSGERCSRETVGSMSLFCIQHQNRAFRKLREQDHALATPNTIAPPTGEDKLAEALRLGDQLADAMTLKTHGSYHPAEKRYLLEWDDFSFAQKAAVQQSTGDK